MTVVGIKHVSYNRKVDNVHVEGVEIHYTYSAKNIEGQGVDKAFIGKSALTNNGGVVPSVGDEIDFVYNRFGKVAGFNVR